MNFSRCSHLALFSCLLSALCVVLPSAIAQTGGSSSNTLPAPKFLYSSDYADSLVYEYLIDASTGEISPTSQVYISSGSGPGRMASDRGGFRLYVGDTKSNEVSAYFINRNNGSLQPVPGSPFAVPGSPMAVAVNPSGKYVYVTYEVNYKSFGLSVFEVQSDGSLMTVNGSPFATMADPVAVIVDASGYYVYVADDPPNGGYVDAYVVNTTTGALTPVSGEPYLVPGKTDGCYPAPPGPGSAATDLAIEEGHLLVAGWCDGQVAVYTINEKTGALTNISGSPIAIPPPCPYCQPGTVSIAVDPLNRWWYLYQDVSVPLSMSYADITTFTPRTRQTNGLATNCGDQVRADPSGKFVYAIGNAIGNQLCFTDGFPGAILGFSVDQSTGLLTPLSGSPWASPTADGQLSQTDGLVVTR